MGNIPLEHGLIVATILFALGFYGVMVRRNLLFMLMSLDFMRMSLLFTKEYYPDQAECIN